MNAIKSRVSAIVPAYNESRHIGNVLEILQQVSCLDVILVVDDGSQDETGLEVLQIAERDSRIQLVSHDRNLGKGQAIYTGWLQTQADYLLLIDADLIGLKPEQVEALIQPVVVGEADMSVGLFRGGKLITDLSHWATPWLSGQRCFYSQMLGCISWQAASGYGFETALTVAATLEGWCIQRVWLEGVFHPPSEGHRGILRGLYNRTRMYSQILRAWYIAGGFKTLKPDLGRYRREFNKYLE